jgi:prolyl oligopeptidase
MVASPKVPGVLVRMEGWIEPPAIVQVDVKGELHKTGLQPPPPIDLSSMDSVRLHAKSADGASIPVTMVYKKTTTLNGRNPTLLTAYGSFGVTLAPTFDPALMAWLERGGVYAIAHVRGGGEYGMAWHLSGMRAQKPNTILDFIAVADFICKYGFTSPTHLAALGTGAGGIPVGGALVRRPDLFAAVVERVPMTDMVRMEETPQGPANIPEFGSATSSAGAAALRAISPYHHVKHAAYPGVLITAGVNDPRMALWQPAKLAARLQSETTSGRPVLLRIEEGGGSPASREQHEEELADIYSFLLWQFEEASKPPPAPPPAPPAPAPEAAPAAVAPSEEKKDAPETPPK